MRDDRSDEGRIAHRESARKVTPPLYPNLAEDDIITIVQAVCEALQVQLAVASSDPVNGDTP